jgi:hypothetical protein
MRLTYINNDRGPYAMDKAVLSSSHLHHLDYTALADRPQAVCVSEMSELKRCLLQARNLKILRLRVGVASWPPNDDYQESPLNLPFRDGDIFPVLEELTLDPMLQNYFPTAEHCEMWSRRMDWVRLHTLDFGYGTPKALLQALTGRVAQLKTLNFGFWLHTGVASAFWNSSKDMEVLERFVDSIDALINVKMHSLDDEDMQKVRPTLLAKHGRSLRSLEAEYGKSVAWKPEHFYALAETAQDIKILRLPMKMQKKEGKDELSTWPDGKATQKTSAVARLKKLFASSSSQKHGISSLRSSTVSSSPSTPPSAAARRSVHSALTSFRHLTQLHLKVYLGYHSYELISYPHPDKWGSPQIKQQVAHELMLRLWHDFGPKSAIQRIEVIFVSPGTSTKLWYYNVSRRWQKRSSDGIWESKVVVEMREEGKDYDPSSFDPFG